MPLHTFVTPIFQKLGKSIQAWKGAANDERPPVSLPLPRSFGPTALVHFHFLHTFLSRRIHILSLFGAKCGEHRDALTDNQPPYRFQHITMGDQCAWPSSIQPGRYLDLLRKDARAGKSRSCRDIEWKVFLEGEWRMRRPHHATVVPTSASFIAPLPIGIIPWYIPKHTF